MPIPMLLRDVPRCPSATNRCVRRSRWTLFIFLLIGGWTTGQAQPAALPLTPIGLDDMQAFAPQGGNWSIAGGVYADRSTTHHFEPTPGTGILVNEPTDEDRDDLYTAWDHGDIELDLEFMMPKGSNSGIYLQGRYEIQLLDSWGVQSPKAGDCGGIYERWDDSKPEGWQGYEGHAPRTNASRAPGLWQHLNIRFEAPRFDANGQKTQNARIVEVTHNGVVIHENVALTGPTRGAAYDQEAPQGPLRIQGDHGPVAFRNIRYKTYAQEEARLTDLRYAYLEGVFTSVPDFSGRPPVLAGRKDGIHWEVGGKDNAFALQYTGTFHAPRAGTYLFSMDLDWVRGDPHFQDKAIGGARLMIGAQEALVHPGRQRQAKGTVDLAAGAHPFTLAYYKNRGWAPHSMALYVEGPGIKRTILNAPEARPAPPQEGAMTVDVGATPVFQRGFVMHNGTKKTHAILVGDPSGVHYSVDLNTGGLLYVWRGDFVEVSDMWRSRGQDQLAVPLGSVLALSGTAPLAAMPDLKAPWPQAQLALNSYTLDEAGYPMFHYTLPNARVHDEIKPAEAGRALQRTLRVEDTGGSQPLWAKIAEGASITQLPDGAYSINDAQFYIVLDHDNPVIQATQNGHALLVPLTWMKQQAEVSYTVVW